jgi:hypothetical protein
MLKRLSKKYIVIVFFIAVGIAGAFVVYNGFKSEIPEVAAGSSHNLTGWIWSSNIGWISLNSLNCDSVAPFGQSDGTPAGCPPLGTPIADYGVNVDLGSGDFSGHAWSSNIGWISFNEGETGAPPSDDPCGALCIANFNFAANEITGWARALSYGAGVDWDGWIKLRKGPADAGADYGVSWDPVTSKFRGFAWGDVVVGWIAFDNTGGDCPFCDSGGDLNVPPVAGVSCSHTPCAAWKQGSTLTPTTLPPGNLILSNDSTDPNWNIVESKWTGMTPSATYDEDIDGDGITDDDYPPAGVGSEDLETYTVQLNPPGAYTMQIEVIDSQALSDTDTIPVTIKQDAEADFECSLDGVVWQPQPCNTIVVGATIPIFFRGKDGTNLSIPSEDGTSIISWIWAFDDGVCQANCGTSGELPNPIQVEFPTVGSKTIQLTVTDDAVAARNDTETKILNVVLPFPEWEEVSPL